MSTERAALKVGALAAVVLTLTSIGSLAQEAEAQSCSEKLTQQLRRFSEKCISDLVRYVESQPELSARISGEKEKFYVALVRHDDGLVAEAVSKFNYPLMKADTPDLLKQLGWQAPENESDNWKKVLTRDAAKTGDAAQEISRALAAYGLKPGEAMSVTIGAEQPK
jgi:DNA topoisomerase VI subunit B